MYSYVTQPAYIKLELRLTHSFSSERETKSDKLFHNLPLKKIQPNLVSVFKNFHEIKLVEIQIATFTDWYYYLYLLR